MTTRHVGPKLEELWPRVDRGIDDLYAGRVEGRPLKVMEAKAHLAGEDSYVIKREAELRGLKADELAGEILSRHQNTMNVALDKALMKTRLQAIKDPVQLLLEARRAGIQV